MAPQVFFHPVIEAFAQIRRIDEGVRDAITECLTDGLTLPQFEVLRLLDSRGDGLSPAEIAQALHAPKSGLTVTLQRLEASGFARVEPCPDDRRKKRVCFTQKGLEAYMQTLAVIRPRMERLREAFTLDEFRDALPFLKALNAWFEERDWA
jgi:DNA-binding MarR family transcriptional regulator